MGLAAPLIKEKSNKGQLRGALMFSLICAWINGWVHDGEAGNLRRNRAHYEVTVMFCSKKTRTMAMWRAHWSDCHHPHLPRRQWGTGGEKMNTVLDGNPPSLWRHQMETFVAFLVLCAGNSPVNYPHKWPVTQSIDVFFDLRLNKRLSKQSRRRWFEPPSRPLRRHRNVFQNVHDISQQLLFRKRDHAQTELYIVRAK